MYFHTEMIVKHSRKKGTPFGTLLELVHYNYTHGYTLQPYPAGYAWIQNHDMAEVVLYVSVYPLAHGLLTIKGEKVHGQER